MTTSRFATVAHDLRERVALGDVGEGGALESEAELCTRYAVSRTTVRRALETLRSEGLVESRHGAGWFVVGRAFHQALALGTFRHAASAITEAGLAVCRSVLDFSFLAAPAPVAAALGLATGTDVLHARSVRTVDGAGLDLVREWVPAEHAGRLSRADAVDPGIWASLARQGRPIASVRQTITAGVAGPSDAQALATSEGAPLLLVRRVALDMHGIPLALSDHRYLAHRFALEVEFHAGPAATTPEPPGLRAVEPQPDGIQENAS